MLTQTRHIALDYVKGALVIGMVLAHALQLLSKLKGIFWLFATGIYLITFSGFFFCFGYVFYLSYLSKTFSSVGMKMAKTAWKSLLAYYLSSFAAFLLLSDLQLKKPYLLTLNELVQLIAFIKLGPVSEFLLTFFLITALVLLFFNGFKRLVASPKLMLVLGIACLLTVILLPPESVISRPWSLFIGTKGESIFPVVQYFPLFLVGLYFAKYSIVWSRPFFGLAFLGTALFAGYYVWNRSMPAEFMPSIFWLVGSYGILYSYFLAARWLERRFKPQQWLMSIGQNTLFYLLLSNFILFSMSNHIQTTPLVALLTGVCILLVISFLISLLAPASQSSNPL